MITLNVPSIACEVCVNTITRAIKNSDPQAVVNIDVVTKLVQVTTTNTEGIITQAIIEAGHTVDNEQ
ncbi:heavy-metal-associated domain-containing protein [Geminocystis sp. GBBB08]|uniref:heavy-metal-associated domain-containing protein n=1 Tax=Geminocystis sp. GBBB08 TaxID=2604140 RepID=UPI0027E2F6A4|nr:heavy-metal-associated domain-containing protein [Geminocystis sp. GBBB08]MBL1210623.1 heavy-metal-associated domain-containing protein [Geminocystis sp. GBBB08]